MLMNNMDEAADIKPIVTIEGKQLELLKIESAAVGQKYELSATATISAIRQEKGEDGIDRTSITFELERVALQPPEADLSGFFANSPKGA